MFEFMIGSALIGGLVVLAIIMLIAACNLMGEHEKKIEALERRCKYIEDRVDRHKQCHDNEQMCMDRKIEDIVRKISKDKKDK